MKTAKRQFSVQVLVLREGDVWVAQCLEYDIAAQGATLPEVKKALERTFIGQMMVDAHLGQEPLDNIPPAPREYWEKFEQGERICDRSPFRLPEAVREAAHVSAASASDLRIYA